MALQTIAIILLLPKLILSDNWKLVDLYQGDNFFNQFTFYTDLDSWHGYVNYVNETEAIQLGLINSTSTSVYIGADYTNKASGRGRNAIRISSNKTYDNGLFMIKMQHMPYGTYTKYTYTSNTTYTPHKQPRMWYMAIAAIIWSRLAK